MLHTENTSLCHAIDQDVSTGLAVVGCAECNAALKRYWRAGCLTPVIYPAIGADKGLPIVCAQSIRFFKETVRGWRRLIEAVPQEDREARGKRLRTVLGGLVRCALVDTSLQEPEWAVNVVRLAAYFFTIGRPDDLAESCGIEKIEMHYDPDESLRWAQRGMLDARFLKKYAFRAPVEHASVH